MPGIDNNTIFILHGNDFKDDSEFNRTVSNYGVSSSDAQKHFDQNQSYYFNGSSYILVDPYDFQNNDFTIDWWEYPEKYAGNIRFWSDFPESLTQQYVGITIGYSYGNIFASKTSGTWDLFRNIPVITSDVNKWTHWAFVRSGTNFRTYKNGVKYWEGTGDGPISHSSDSKFSVGHYKEGSTKLYFQGYIQEFRVSNVARWTSDFEPPTEPYTDKEKITVTQPRENDRTTYVRQFTFNKVGEYNSRRDGAIVSGTPLSGTLLSAVPIGTIVNISENSTPTRFIVVQHGHPTADNGRTLLTRESLCDRMKWNANIVNTYADSTVDEWLNNEYLNLIDSNVRSQISSVDIPYTPGNGNYTVTTLSRKVFLPSCTEIMSTIPTHCNIEGSQLSYFQGKTSRSDYIGYLNGSPAPWPSRSPMTTDNEAIHIVNAAGYFVSSSSNLTYAPRPMFTLPDTLTLSLEPNPDGSYDIII